MNAWIYFRKIHFDKVKRLFCDFLKYIKVFPLYNKFSMWETVSFRNVIFTTRWVVGATKDNSILQKMFSKLVTYFMRLFIEAFYWSVTQSNINIQIVYFFQNTNILFLTSNWILCTSKQIVCLNDCRILSFECIARIIYL